MIKEHFFTLASVGLLLAGCNQSTNNTGQQESQQADNKDSAAQAPNIVLIMTDDVTFRHWSCYGGEVPTPNIDRIANEGMIFTEAYTTSAACTPSRYSIMTGQYPGRCHHPDFLSEGPESEPYVIAWNTPITEKNLTLHEVLNQGGYYTGFVGKFHIGSLDFDKPDANPDIPKIDPDLSPDTKQADDLLAAYQEVIAQEVKRLTGADYVAAVQWENPETIPIKAVQRHHLEYQTQGVADFFDSVPQGQSFFLHLNSTALHGPNHYDDLKTDARFTPGGSMTEPYRYHPPRETIFERLDSLNIEHGEDILHSTNHYNAGILYMDDQVGAVLKMLDDKGLTENTIVIVTADHNIEPGKSTIYDRGVNVPFAIRWPAKIKAHSQCNEMVQFTDFLPTFAELAGVTIESDQEIDGKSFVPVFEGKSIEGRNALFFEEGYTRGVSNKKMKYIAMRFPAEIINKLESGEQEAITHMGNGMHGHAYIAEEYHPGYMDADQLYDLEKDPFEQNNLAKDPAYAEQLKSMQQLLQIYLTTFKHPFDLSDSGYEAKPSYQRAVAKTRARGTDFIPWWDRKLDYPPKVPKYEIKKP